MFYFITSFDSALGSHNLRVPFRVHIFFKSYAASELALSAAVATTDEDAMLDLRLVTRLDSLCSPNSSQMEWSAPYLSGRVCVYVCMVVCVW